METVRPILSLCFTLCFLFTTCFAMTAPPVSAADKGSVAGTSGSPFPKTKDIAIQQVKPKKPVKIKLHRNANGEYMWDLTGDDVDELVKADKRLRKLLNIE